jgi:hypothetical protein
MNDFIGWKIKWMNFQMNVGNKSNYISPFYYYFLQSISKVTFTPPLLPSWILFTSTTFLHLLHSYYKCHKFTWTFDNSVFVQFNKSIEMYQGWCAMCWKKCFLAPLLKILPPSFRHVLCGRIFSINRSIFCTATSFMAIVILVVVMGDKLNIAITWTCQQNIGGQI